MIQDTSFIIDVLNGDNKAIEFLKVIETDNKPQKISSITVLELYEGIKRSNKPQNEKKRVLDVLNSKQIISCDHSIMKKAGNISGNLYNNGTPIDREDCIIAATSILEDEKIVTKNKNHFDKIPNIKTISY